LYYGIFINSIYIKSYVVIARTRGGYDDVTNSNPSGGLLLKNLALPPGAKLWLYGLETQGP